MATLIDILRAVHAVAGQRETTPEEMVELEIAAMTQLMYERRQAMIHGFLFDEVA